MIESIFLYRRLSSSSSFLLVVVLASLLLWPSDLVFSKAIGPSDDTKYAGHGGDDPIDETENQRSSIHDDILGVDVERNASQTEAPEWETQKATPVVHQTDLVSGAKGNQTGTSGGSGVISYEEPAFWEKESLETEPDDVEKRASGTEKGAGRFSVSYPGVVVEWIQAPPFCAQVK